MFFETSLAHHYVDSKSESKTLSRLFVIDRLKWDVLSQCKNVLQYYSHGVQQLLLFTFESTWSKKKKKKEVKLKGAIIFDN